MHNLGQWFKKRYCNLTGELYQSDRIFVESSDIDRTIMSAMSFLYGYYPATGTQIWKTNEMWQPIPVHTIPQNNDSVRKIMFTTSNPDTYLETGFKFYKIRSIST